MANTPLTLPPLVDAFMKDVVQKHNPKAQILRKSASWPMKAIGLILKPVNKTFMQNYVTTIGGNIYVPDDFFNSRDEMESLEVIAHEHQHVLDDGYHGFLFKLSYLFPQCMVFMALPALLAFLNPWMLFCLLGLIALAPFPAPFRFRWELNGYRTSILFARKVRKATDEQMVPIYDWIKEQLSGPAYYYTWSKDKMDVHLKDESFMTLPRYQEVTDFLKAKGKLPA